MINPMEGTYLLMGRRCQRTSTIESCHYEYECACRCAKLAMIPNAKLSLKQ